MDEDNQTPAIEPPSPEALFRYTVLSQIIARELCGEARAQAIAAVAAHAHATLEGALRAVSARSLYRWLAAFETLGFGGLVRKSRKGVGASTALDEAFIAFCKNQKRQDSYISVPELIRRARERQLIVSEQSMNRSTVWRRLKREGLDTARRPAQKTHNCRENKWRIQFIRLGDKETLEAWRKSSDKRLWDRAVTILENNNLRRQEIAAKIERPVSVVQGWIKAFNRHGIDGIRPRLKKRAPDRRALAREFKKRRIIEILHDRPSSFGINRSNWNLSSLASAYENRYSESISRSTVSRLIRASGYGLKKAKTVLTSPDPAYREKVELVLRTLQNLQTGELFFFIDEMGPVRVKKHGGRMYSKRTETPTIPQGQSNKGSVTLSGALSATTNQVTWIYGKSKDTFAMIDLIELLFNQYNDVPAIYITWDAASWHDSLKLNEWLDEFNSTTRRFDTGPVIFLVPLPTSSQFLDVIESIFSGMKRAVIHHSDYKSDIEMKEAISCHLRERNDFFKENPKRVGKKIWQQEFFSDFGSLPSGNYREW